MLISWRQGPPTTCRSRPALAARRTLCPTRTLSEDVETLPTWDVRCACSTATTAATATITDRDGGECCSHAAMQMHKPLQVRSKRHCICAMFTHIGHCEGSHPRSDYPFLSIASAGGTVQYSVVVHSQPRRKARHHNATAGTSIS